MKKEKRHNHRYVIYLGFVMPKERALKYLNSFAGNEAETNFVKYALGDFKTYVCSYAYNLFSDRKKIYNKGKTFTLSECDFAECYGIPVLNIPVLKRLFSLAEIKKYLKKTVESIKKEDSQAEIKIITCNSYPLFSYPALWASKKYGIEIISWLIDGFYYEGKANLIRIWNERKAQKNLKKYPKVVALSHNVLKDFCDPGQRQMSITPIIFEEKREDFECKYFDKKYTNIMFAGGIAPLNGISLYCELSKLLKPNYRFHLFGRGEIQAELEDFVKDKENIIYHGVLSHDELMQAEKRADILIIVRPTKNSEQNGITKYGIPFKLIEYLQSGVPVVASKMEAVPEEMNKFINICDAEVNSVLKKIEEVASDYEACKEKALKAQEYMRESCSWKKYGTVLKEFIYE